MSRTPECILRIEYPDHRSVHKPYMIWKNAVNARRRILSDSAPGISAHVYKLADEVYQLSMFNDEEEPEF